MTTLPGINIQWPWSSLLLEGKKTIETRSYPIPEKHVGKTLAIIETPGPRGKREAGIVKARIIGTIVFASCKEYHSQEEWQSDEALHLVPTDDPQYQFTRNKPKWGWIVKQVSPLPKHASAPKKRGIVFATKCTIP